MLSGQAGMTQRCTQLEFSARESIQDFAMCLGPLMGFHCVDSQTSYMAAEGLQHDCYHSQMRVA